MLERALFGSRGNYQNRAWTFSRCCIVFPSELMAVPLPPYAPFYGTAERATAAGSSAEHSLRGRPCDGSADGPAREQTTLNYEFACGTRLGADERERDD